MDENSTQFRPPHMSFATLNNFIGDLASRPLPPQVDRMMLSHKSGTDQNNLMSTLTAFGLIDQAQRVQPKLQALAVEDKDARKAELEKLVREFYPSAVELSQGHGTQQQLIDIFRDELGVEAADTRRKAITFFLHALAEAGIPVSANFKKTRSGSGSPGATRSGRKSGSPRGGKSGRNGPGTTGGDSPPANPSTSNEASYSTEVKIGKDTTLILTAKNPNPFGLTKDDREFIFGLIDAMNDYASKHPDLPTDNGAAPDDTEDG